jgi:ribosomal protein S11
MAKATKKRKVIVESTEKPISATFNNIIISLTNKKR